MKEFNKLVGYRNRCGLSQRKLGECLGITASAYSAKENGKAPFTLNDMKIIHSILESTLQEPIDFKELFNI
ncbi:helix-turn-helix domain-containing protein [Veillonella caviae]|uniref:helix-turn-helix domain-containing protein n=1 Tax=Veillonella caviae TaxID=248316 RepID=UPI0023A8864E|nr:helix-turn-helix transcriptional regulator [Veillonella caviae]MCI5708965.1 helix-turn-helix domain-containing protein [Veillonella caviae]MCI6407676.1 helix-turn-helix domain-containing protein [Veillonella caviae]MDY5714958.1 helix-turn-helix transcriptional regulator [Veillonella caviae]MDY6225792.1 helix-turn-helix transcriptional regulator [Veillonella caviae]